MGDSPATTAAVISAAAAVLALLVSGWSVVQARATRRVEAHRAVHELYDRMVSLKFGHPEFLICAQEWDPGKMRNVYDDTLPNHQMWAEYYTFVELCIGFANAVLQARNLNLMDKGVYQKQWERLVRLVLTEHYPIVGAFVSEGPYVSQYVCKYVSVKQSEGWDWAGQHRQLPWP